MSRRRLEPNAELEVAADDLAVTGAGIGVARGAPIHVRDLLPGERALVRVEHVSRHAPNTAFARVLRRLGPPADERVQPQCPHFAECGGCAWQHLDYPAQLRHKRERVVRALSTYGLPHNSGSSDAVAAAIPAPAITGYRSIGKYVAGRTPDGSLLLGSYAPRSHRVVDTAGCRIIAPVINYIHTLATRALARLPVYDERTRTGWLRYLTIRQGSDETALVAIVTTATADRPTLTRAAAELCADPRVAGVVWIRNDSPGGTILHGPDELLCGRPGVAEQVAGVAIELGVRDFFQVNRSQVARLYTEVARLSDWPGPAADPRELRAIDLYCGVGGIAFTLAALARAHRRTSRITGLERDPQAVAAARRAAERAGLSESLSFTAADAATVTVTDARDPLDQPDDLPIDLITVNPPRKGLSADTRAALRELRPARITYVSCGPKSLARDLAELTEFIDPAPRYRITGIQPIDLMPGTPQIETIVALQRRD